MSDTYGGEWRVNGKYGAVGVEVIAGGRSMCIVNRVSDKRLKYLKRSDAGTGERAPDDMRNREIAQLEASWAQAQAQAQLIAAAPDLLAAAQAALTQLGLIGLVNAQRSIKKGEVDSGPILRALHEAIMKAGADPAAN